MNASSESGLCATRMSLFKSPHLSVQIILRNFPQHRAGRISEAIVNKADVSAPAAVAADLARFFGARVRLPEHLEIHVGAAQISDRRPHLAGADAPVEVDDRGSFSGRAAHRPGGRS